MKLRNKMKTHTKQVEEVGCGIKVKDGFYCGEYKYLCLACKSILKGMQTAIQSELGFLERDMFDFMNLNGTCYRIMNNKITDCKNALAKIKEAGI